MKPMDRAWIAAPLLLAASAAFAADKPARGEADYLRDVISVATSQRHDPAPSANCTVWANAEGFGVGPEQLGGLHGLVMIINPKPLPSETGLQPSTFASALPALKAQFPKAPAWLFATLEKQGPAIDAACVQDHEDPVPIHRITAADRGKAGS